MTSRLVSSIFRRSDLDNATLTDPVSKFRVSQPQTLIDTDFEYGLQSTKWETIELINNIPVFFSRTGDDTIGLTDVYASANSDIIKVTTSSPCGFIQGTPFIVQGLKTSSAEGAFVVFKLSTTDTNVFYYKAREVQEETGSIYDPYSTSLYPGRLYQSTQFNSDHLVNISTNEEVPDQNGNGSTISVITKFPHGFKVNSKFTLANSVGIRQINFDASAVDPRNSFSVSNIISYTNSNNGLLTSFRSRNVIPYDFESKKTLSFAPENIDLTNNRIYVPNHGQLDSTVSSNIYLYQAPIDDNIPDGLQNNSFYGIKKIDDNNISLYEVSPSYLPGLWGFTFKQGTANVLSTTAPKHPFVENTDVGTSTFNVGIWTGNASAGTVAIPDAANYGSSIYMQHYLDPLGADNNFGRFYVYAGYFKPKWSGNSNFEVRAIDYAYMWFGSNATWMGQVAPAAAPTPQLTIAYAAGRTSLSLGTSIGIGTFTATNLIAGEMYPILIVTGNDNTATGIGTAGNPSVLSLRTERQGVAYPAFGTLQNFDGFFQAPIIGKGPTGTTVRPFQIQTNRLITLRSQGSSNYGLHTLQKAFPVLNLTAGTDHIYTLGLNATNYTDSLVTGGTDMVIINGTEYTSNYFIDSRKAAFTRHIFGSGLNPTAATRFTNYGECLQTTYSNVSIPDYKKLKSFGRPGFTLTVGVGSAYGYANYSTTDVTFTGGTDNQPVLVKNSLLFNLMGAIPVNNFIEYDGFFYAGHGYSENDIVTLTNLDTSKQLPRSSATTGEGVIQNGSTYKIGVINTDFFRLKQLTNGNPIDLVTVGNAQIKFTKTVINTNKDTIYAPSHNLVDGTQIRYFSSNQSSIPGLNAGNTYYVYNSTTNRFQLSSNATNPNANLADITDYGQGIHYFQTVDRDTDANYTVINTDTYNMTLQSTGYIPRRIIPFYPPSVLDLSRYSFYIPDHRLTTGSIVGYSNFNTSAFASSNIAGLSIRDYYTIRLDTKTIQLADTLPLALSNIPVQVWNYGYGSNHLFQIKSLQGEIPIYNSISLISTASNLALSLCNISPNLDFLQVLKKGDTFNAEIPGQEYIDFYGASNDSVNMTVTFWHNSSNIGANGSIYTLNIGVPSPFRFNTGDPVYYEKYGIGGTSWGAGHIGLSNNTIYYVRPDGAGTANAAYSRFFLYNTSNDALLDQNRVRILQPNSIIGAFQTTQYGAKFTKRIPNNVFTTKVNYINNAYSLELSNNSFYLTSNAHFINKTFLFPKADGYSFHRAYDGGVEMVPTTNPDTKFIRQTRRYFRYQSGKGLQCSKAVNFNASYDIQSLTRNYNGIANYALARTRFPHRVRPTAYVRITGVVEGGSELNNWNSSNETHYFYVSETPSLNTLAFYYPLNRLPESSIAGGYPQLTVRNWSQSRLNVGMFDDQNGMFYQYDGQQLYAVRRNSTKQLPGYAVVTFGSCRIQGNTYSRFSSTLSVDDYIVIKGCSYKVSYIESDSIIYVQPPYRGNDNFNVIITKTIDERFPQAQWTIDSCDGNGPTGYNIDITKIQMIYMDYSWYGAGKVRFGFKAVNGEVRYVHEILHNNRFNEAYLRSGNLPGRYEVQNLGNPTFTPSLMHWGTSIIMDGRYDDDKAYLFTTTSKILAYYGAQSKYFGIFVDNSAFTRSKDPRYNTQSGPYYNPNTGQLERTYRMNIQSGNPNGVAPAFIAGTTFGAYTTESIANASLLKPGTVLTGIPTSAASNILFGDWTGATQFSGGAGQLRLGSFTKKSNTATVLNVSQASGNLAYFYMPYSVGQGSELITAGQDGDIPTGFVPLVSLRLAPSVDNGKASLLGVREIINRMQLNLASVGILTTHDVEIQLRLNGYPSTNKWLACTAPSLTQYIAHDKGDTISGGTSIYSFRAQGGSVSQVAASVYSRGANSTTFDLAELATLGNSIIGGDNVFPDGPDVLTIGFILLDSSYISLYTPFTCTARLSWKESQA